MKLNRLLALGALAITPTIALAYPVTLEFETPTPTSFASIADFYNGGADGAGLIGPALGVSFNPDALALQNDAAGPYFSNAPSPIGIMTPVGPDATMNVGVGGFSDISFYYSSSSAVAGGVQAWSGPNGTGALLASFDLANNAQTGCSDTPYCNFDRISSGPLGGVARSLTFANNIAAGFDNITVSQVPEPSTAFLFTLGLAGLLAAHRRRGSERL